MGRYLAIYEAVLMFPFPFRTKQIFALMRPNLLIIKMKSYVGVPAL